MLVTIFSNVLQGQEPRSHSSASHVSINLSFIITFKCRNTPHKKTTQIFILVKTKNFIDLIDAVILYIANISYKIT